MVQASEQAIRAVVKEVLAQLGKRPAGNGAARARSGDWGVFRTVDEAVEAATGILLFLMAAQFPTKNRLEYWVRDQLQLMEVEGTGS